MTALSIDAQIVSTPDILNGRPRIAGHRISIRDIVLWYEYLGMSPDEIAAQYELTLTQVFAALAYFHANREDLKKNWREEDQWVDQLRQAIPSKIQK